MGSHEASRSGHLTEEVIVRKVRVEVQEVPLTRTAVIFVDIWNKCREAWRRRRYSIASMSCTLLSLYLIYPSHSEKTARL